ncbi:MAG: FtsX-like permease family protein [Gammaproteobacteria bacterium]|nr:FtsX-like permease family protein [Gammaproteobacteria bacterium]
MTIFWTLLSHYRRHPVQGLFLLTGIVIANVLLVGTLLINAQARASYSDGERILGAGPVAQIQSTAEREPVSARDYVRLRREGFDMVAPVLRRMVRTAGGEPLELLGIDLFAMTGMAAAGADSESAPGGNGFADFPFPPYQTWAAPGRLEQLGWSEGEPIELDSGDVLPGIVPVPDRQLGHRMLLDIGALQALTDSDGEISYLAVFPAASGRLADLRAALPDYLEFVTGAEAPDPAELTRSFHLNLAAMGLLAFVVGIFLTYNALAFSYTDRRELIRKLRLAGVTRSELKTGLSLELLIFLLGGSLIGFLLGAQMAAWLLPGVGRTLAQLYGVYIAYPDGLVPAGIWLPLLMTAIAAGLCALFPLRESLDTPLLERWQTRWQEQVVVRRDRLMLLASVVFLLTALVLGVTAGSLWLALAGMASLLLGAALLLPTVLRILLAGLQRLIPARKARLSWLIADSRWLLGPASLALMAMTLALVANSGLNTMISSFRVATDEWLDQRLAADLYLRSRQEPAELRAWLAGQSPELSMAERYRTSLTAENPRGNAVQIEVVSLQPGNRFENSVDLIRSEQNAQQRFRAGEGVYISERAWRLDGWQSGQPLNVCENRPDLPVLGVYHDYGNPQSQWMLDQALFENCWPRLASAGQAIYGPKDTEWESVSAQLSEAFELDEGQLIDQVELKQIGLAVFDRTFTVTHALNALTLLVAGIGMFCAVSAIHHHRVGQQALLASLGVSRRERGWLLLSQWGLLGLLCMSLVWPFGTVLAAYLAAIVTPVAFGWSFPLHPDLQHYILLAVIASGSLILAVALPSFRLLKTSPAALLREQAL